jgi:TolB-like protein
MSSSVVRFGAFEVHFRSGELRKSGVRLKLPGQPLQVLEVLLEQPGVVISRDELRRRLWADDTFVDFDNALNTAVNKLREVLCDTATNPRFIETLPRRGYRFIAHVDLPAAAVQAPERSGKPMLVVLPFDNLGGDPEQEYFADGLTEEMISHLGRLHSARLGVIARTSAMQYKGTHKSVLEIGRELGVDFVLEGTVRRGGDRVRITAQLIRASDQVHLWAESYDRTLVDILDIQTEVAHHIGRSLAMELLPGEPRSIPPLTKRTSRAGFIGAGGRKKASRKRWFAISNPSSWIRTMRRRTWACRRFMGFWGYTECWGGIDSLRRAKWRRVRRLLL